jgi:hypothetical protein
MITNVIKIALFLLISTCTLSSTNDDYYAGHKQSSAQYNPKIVTDLIDFKKDQTHIYIFGENHTQARNYNTKLENLSNEQRLFYLDEGLFASDKSSLTTHYHRGIDDMMLRSLMNFFEFLSWHKLTLLEENRTWCKSPTLDTLWSWYKNDANHPKLQAIIKTNYSNAFYSSLTKTHNPSFICEDLEFQGSILNATFDLLNLIQNEKEYAFTESEYRQITQWLQKCRHTLKPRNKVTFKEEENLLFTSILIDKRNTSFALNIAKTYNEVKNKNLPIAVTMGSTHLQGVSALLKEKGISHTCINLETMTVIEPSLN